MRCALKTLGEPRGIGLERGHVAVDLGELGATERGEDLVVPVHPAERVCVVIAILVRRTRLTERPDLLGSGVDGLVVRHEHAALAGAEALVLIEAEGSAVAEGTNLLAFEGGSVRLAAVLDHLEVVLLCDGHYLVHVHGETVEMDNDDRLRGGRNGGFDLFGIDVHRIEIDVHEHGNRVVVQNARGGRRPGIRRHKHMVALAQSAPRHAHVQRRRAGVGRDGELIAVPRRELLLKRFAVVRGTQIIAFQRGQNHFTVGVIDRRPFLHGAVRHGLGTAVDCELCRHGSLQQRGRFQPDASWLDCRLSRAVGQAATCAPPQRG